LATVITNFASAIPYVGKDIVYFVWGKENEDYLLFSFIFSFSVLNTFKPSSQCDNKFVAMFIGLVDGDGYIGVVPLKKEAPERFKRSGPASLKDAGLKKYILNYL
jgi:hypothetical protein